MEIARAREQHDGHHSETPEKPPSFAIAREQFLSPKFLRFSKQADKKTAAQQGRYSFLLARYALYHALRALRISPGDEIMVPSYICAAAVEAIEAYGAAPIFFRIGRDCAADFEDIKNRISTRSRALMIAHYFGFPQDLRAARDVADRYKLLLIEDCAHVLPGRNGENLAGGAGDAAVFSWRKFLPTLYGAELVLNSGAALESLESKPAGLGFELRTIKSLLDSWTTERKTFAARLMQAPGDLVRVLRRPFAHTNLHLNQEDLATHAKSCDFEPLLMQHKLSRVSQFISVHSDIAAITIKRRTNYKNLAERLASVSGVHLLFPELPENITPLHLPLIFCEVSGAHRQLRQSGIPATAWDGVRPPRVADDAFPDAAFLYENLVFLPVHQNLGDRDLDLIMDSVRNVSRQQTQKSTFALSAGPNQGSSTLISPENSATGPPSEEKVEPKRVLMVAYHFPPYMGSSGLLRSLKYCRYLPQHGWQPTILTVHPRAYEKVDSSQLAEVPPSVKIIRAFALDTRRHLSLRGRYLGFTALPDRWVTWCVGASISGVAHILKDKTNVIFTTFPIATAVLIGYLLHRMTGVPWVVDFRDSMTEDEYPIDPRVRKVYSWIEKKAVRYASRLVFTARSTRRMYLERYPELSPEKCLVISNGYDEDDFLDLSAPEIQPGTCLHICHSGIIYPEERDPVPFFEALSRLKHEKKITANELSVDLRACGHESTYREIVARLNLEDLVHFLPPIPYRQALEESNRADILLLMQASCCDHQIPAKAYEYLRLGKPILALTSHTGDTAAVLEECGGATIVDLADRDAIYRALPEFLRVVRAGEHPLPSREAASKYSRQNQAGQLALCLSQLVESTAAHAAVSAESEIAQR